MTMTKSISQQLAEKTFRELGIDPKNGKPLPVNSRNTPVDSRSVRVNSPFRIPALEKTKRQAASTQGYKASASWQTASLLRDLFVLWFDFYTPVITRKYPVDIRLFSRLKAQILDSLRSVVSTFEEGWARPSTKEFLDYIGFSQASLAEARGDTERIFSEGLISSSKLKSQSSEMKHLGIPTPSRNFPYPPVKSRNYPGKYGKLQVKLREYTGKDLNPKELTYELFIELINKTDYLLGKAVTGLQRKMIEDEKKKLKDQIDSHWRKEW